MVNTKKYVFLATAMIYILDKYGQPTKCRAVLDSGSQSNFVTERLWRKLGLNYTNDGLDITGIGNSKQRAERRVKITLGSYNSGYKTDLEAFVLPCIAKNQPHNYIEIKDWPIPTNIKLADPQFNVPQKIDVLIGAEIYASLMSIGQIKIDEFLPTLQNSVLGWLIIGSTRTCSSSEAFCGISSASINAQIERFWSLEEVDSGKKPMTAAERYCEEHFKDTTRRDKDGRFIVRLPFRQDHSTLGQSKELAMKRFFSIERKLLKNTELKMQYTSFMREYEELGHMEQVSVNTISDPHYFIPHHGVHKPDSSTTKLRVVFDASAKTTTNISLNEILHTGPAIQDDLFSILIRFRLYKHVFTADIEKMYRQIWVDKGDQNFQLIIWRENPEDKLKYYRLKTLTYGTTSAPYLAVRCLRTLADDHVKTHPLGAKAALEDFYVDDIMTGADDIMEALKLQTQLREIIDAGKLRLRKWCSNRTELLKHVPKEDIEPKMELNDEKEGHVKTLGITWWPQSDIFAIKTNWSEETKITKRTVLSDIARLFDPLGIVNPVIVQAKIFLQQLWLLKMDWDAALPLELYTQWKKFRNGLKDLNSLTVPRYVCSNAKYNLREIHGFADASEKAYGAVVYIRTIDMNGKVTVRLLCSKSRVAPTKSTTLPRLELCAAKLLAEVIDRLHKCTRMSRANTYYWTDSTIVLSWLQSESSSFKTFVANRISTIQELSAVNRWSHVSTKDNPADLVSRGTYPSQLLNSNLWFNGPSFLQEAAFKFTPGVPRASVNDPERKTSPLNLLSVKECPPLLLEINHRNSFPCLLRIVAYIKRFINNLKAKKGERQGCIPPNVEELEAARTTVIKFIQLDFKDEIAKLNRGFMLDSKNKLASLTPFLDTRGIIRVGGRLEASNLSFDAKHPILLSDSHPFTKLLLNHLHIQHLHCGPQALLAATRQHFWPLKGKVLTRSIVHHCMKCARARPRPLSQLMGNLPSDRVQPARPFLNAGVDFCGPIFVHYKIRGKHPQKAYVAIFCCFATKGVHLEIVSDLSTNGFIGALKRFIARRGLCRNLYCDNASNFIGARNQFEEIQKVLTSQQSTEEIKTFCTNKGFDFHFIPARAPHFGGLWEAAVKSAKHHLKRTVTSVSLTYEELETVMVEIEAVLNSRPITPLSSDPNDLTALTPAHFLIGEPLTAAVDPTANAIKSNLLERWKLVSYIRNEFWRRWSREYLSELQQRNKWKLRSQNIQTGTMVVIKDDNLSPLKWQLGRITEAIKGADGLVRVADVRTTSGILRRPIHSLCPLPAAEDNKETEKNSASTTLNTVKTHPIKRTISHPNKGRFLPINSNWHKSSSNTTPQPSTSSEEMVEKEEPAKKKLNKGGISYSALSLFLLTLFIPPIFSRTVEPIEITNFDHQPGVYFENLGITNLVTNEWNLIVFYDLENYWKELQSFEEGVKRLSNLCDSMPDGYYCKAILTQFDHHLTEIRDNNELLLDQHRSTKGKTKRSPLDFIGSIANKLFGVLDQDYANRASEIIDNLKTNDEYLLQLLKNQTSLIESTTNIMKKSVERIDKQFESFEAILNQILGQVHERKTEAETQRISQLANALSIYISLVMTNYQQLQEALIEVITDTRHGRINPLLLTPKQLQTQLINIKNHLPSTLRLPGPDEDINLHQLYTLMKVQSEITSQHIIFNIRLPLFTRERFEMFRLLSVPVLINNTFMAIKPSTNYLLVSLHRDSFYQITDIEVAHCNAIEKIRLCKQRRPIFNKEASKSQCEITLINNQQDLSTCKIIDINETQRWIQLSNPNYWIYAVRQETRINIVCGTSTFQRTIKDSGLLKFCDNCEIKQELMTISSHNTYPLQLRASFVPSLNLSNNPGILEAKEMSHSTPPAKLEIHRSHLNDINELQRAIQQLKGNQHLPAKIQPHDIHQFTIGYLALAIIAAIVLYIGIKAWPSRGKKPTPMPRSTTKPEDFTFEA